MIKRFSFSVLFAAILPGLAAAQMVTVDTPAELASAYAQLSTAPGGGTIGLAAGFPAGAEINLSGGGSNPVHITSADPSDPVRVSRIALDNADNIRVSRLRVNGDGIVAAGLAAGSRHHQFLAHRASRTWSSPPTPTASSTRPTPTARTAARWP
jgi:hypothetical protein